MPTDIQALRALLDKATPGELRLSGVGDGTVGTLIVAAVNALPDLLRKVEELRAAPVEKPDTCCKASGCTMDANGVCDLTALPPLPALPEGVRPLVFDSTGVAAEPHDVTALSDEAIVHAAASSFEDAQAIARVMYAAAEWHRAGFDLVPVRRTP